MSEKFSEVNEKLLALGAGYARGDFDFRDYRNSRRAILNEALELDPAEADRTRPRAAEGGHSDATNPVTAPTSRMVDDWLEDTQVPAVEARRPRGRRSRLILGCAGAVVAIAVLAALLMIPVETEEPIAGDAARPADARRVIADPPAELRQLMADTDWSAADVANFIEVWRALSVEQRFELRLLPEFSELRRRAQGSLAAGQDARGDVQLVNAKLRHLLVELE